MVDGDVGGGHHQHLAHALACEVVDDGGGGDGLARAGGALGGVDLGMGMGEV